MFVLFQPCAIFKFNKHKSDTRLDVAVPEKSYERELFNLTVGW